MTAIGSNSMRVTSRVAASASLGESYGINVGSIDKSIASNDQRTDHGEQEIHRRPCRRDQRHVPPRLPHVSRVDRDRLGPAEKKSSGQHQTEQRQDHGAEQVDMCAGDSWSAGPAVWPSDRRTVGDPSVRIFMQHHGEEQREPHVRYV